MITPLEQEIIDSNLSALISKGLEHVMITSHKAASDDINFVSVAEKLSQLYFKKLSPIISELLKSTTTSQEIASPILQKELGSVIFNTIFNYLSGQTPKVSKESYNEAVVSALINISNYAENNLGFPLEIDLGRRLGYMRQPMLAKIACQTNAAIIFPDLKEAIKINADEQYTLEQALSSFFTEIEKQGMTAQGVVLAPETFKLVFRVARNNMLEAIRNFQETPTAQITNLKMQVLNRESQIPTNTHLSPTPLQMYLGKYEITQEQKRLLQSIDSQPAKSVSRKSSVAKL